MAITPFTITETDRLLLRRMTNEDYTPLAAILQDEKTMFAYEGAFSDDETQSWLDKNISRYENDGFGLWAVILKNSGEMIGQAGITWQDIEGGKTPEIGYLLNRSFWGFGYATEAAAACKKYGFEELGFNELFSIIRDINLPSMNVAIRNGMLVRGRTIRNFRGISMQHYIFSVRR